jgi:aspartate racemase
MLSEDKDAVRRTIGIIGGLGPHAHIELERLLLRATIERLGRPPRDQDYPDWLVSSLPSTPDRTRALLGHGPSPVPALLESLRRLAGTPDTPRADFAIIACNTAHAFIDELRTSSPLPILNMVETTVRAARARVGDARVGLLATTGTLRSDLYPSHARRAELSLDIISLLGLQGGDALQERLVMTPIYGPIRGATRAGGIKSGLITPKISDALREGVIELGRAGATLVICGCTEIPLVLGNEPIQGIELLDPMALIAARAVAIAFGDEPCPRLGDT